MLTTRYDFRNAVNAFFELPVDVAEEILPGHLQPLEVQHGTAVLALTAFDFTESLVGPYQEILLAVIVPPRVRPGHPFPVSAFYPFIVGTSTRASRVHAIERWHLPHHPAEIEVDFDESDGGIAVAAREGGRPILEFTVSDHGWNETEQIYQAFMSDASGRYLVDLRLKGLLTEHEDQTGSGVFHDHPMCRALAGAEIPSAPFREMWMKDGRQLFDELASH